VRRLGDGGERLVVVHSLEHALAAAEAAAALGVPVTLGSAAGAASYAGAGWFKALIEAAAAARPEAALGAVLDCADEAGTALGALRHGVRRVRYSGPDDAAERLAAIAASAGATLERRWPDRVLDLLDAPDPGAACRRFLAGNE